MIWHESLGLDISPYAARELPYATLAEAWGACHRGDRMLWLAVRLEVDQRYVVAAACACAQGVLHLVPEGEERPRRAVETAIAWTQGTAALKEVRAAADAAYAAYAAWVAADAAGAADAAYAAAATAEAVADAAYAAADAAAYAARAAARAADVATRESALRQCAERVRAVIPWEMVAEAAERRAR